MRHKLTTGTLCLAMALLIWALVAALLLRATLHAASHSFSSAGALAASMDEKGVPGLAEARLLREDLGRLEKRIDQLRGVSAPVACLLTHQSVWAAARDASSVVCDGLELATRLANVAWWGALEIESATEQYGRLNTASGVPITRLESPLGRAIERLSAHRAELLGLYPRAERLAESAARLPLPKTFQSAAVLGPSMLDGLLLAPEMLGGDDERLYLVLFQNSDELRPTGGFISSVLLLRMQGSRLASFEYMNSYDVETESYEMPSAPDPLARYMRLGGLVFRDANWSPDFPTSAEVLASLYQASRGEAVDGVVAVDTRFLQLLLTALGPVPVEPYQVTISADNLLDLAEGYWENPEEGTSIEDRETDFWGWLEHRKDFGGAFVEATMTRLEGLSTSDGLRLAAMLDEATQTRHLQIWAPGNAQAQADLARGGRTGAIDQSPGDYLMVVDANLGYNKVDRNIEREMAYTVTLSGEHPQAELQLTYRNISPASSEPCVNVSRILDSYEALTQQCYWDYVRVLVPQGAEIIDIQGAQGSMDYGMDGKRLSVGTLVLVPPGESTTVTVRYTLPDAVAQCDASSCTYALTVQKQAGIDALHLTLSADVSPQGLQITPDSAASPAWPVHLTSESDIQVRWTFQR